MSCSFQVIGLKTDLIKPGDSLFAHLADSIARENLEFQDHDIIAIAESAVATAQGRVIAIEKQSPSFEAIRIATEYEMDPCLVEIILSESDSVIGGIPGFLLCVRSGHLLPNAGIDGSNAPPGYVTLLPENPGQVASDLRAEIHALTSRDVAVLIIDSRTHPMRYGCSGISIACSGIPAVLDERGKTDLFGKELKATRRAMADNIASAAELVMGESDESIPAALIRGLSIPFGEFEGIEQISPEECLFIGTFLRREKIIKE